MSRSKFHESLALDKPPQEFCAPLTALWWDSKGEWARAHDLVDQLASTEGMAVHAYLHRKEGSLSNADYWYGRAGRMFYRAALKDEWLALVEGLLLAGPEAR
jgi:hypothetical protein